HEAHPELAERVGGVVGLLGGLVTRAPPLGVLQLARGLEHPGAGRGRAGAAQAARIAADIEAALLARRAEVEVDHERALADDGVERALDDLEGLALAEAAGVLDAVDAADELPSRVELVGEAHGAVAGLNVVGGLERVLGEAARGEDQ